MSWRYKGGPGSGALADVGSHLTYVAEFLCGDIKSISGGRLSTVIDKRPLALGAVMGHDHAAVSDTFEPVENDDYAVFSAEFENGAGGFEVSRVAAGHANSLIFEVFCEIRQAFSVPSRSSRSSRKCRSVASAWNAEVSAIE